MKNACSFLLLLLFLALVGVNSTLAQDPPDREFVFLEDRRKLEQARREKEALSRKRREERQSGDPQFDIDAESITFDSTGKKIIAEGNVLISYGSTILEADQCTYDSETEQADLSGALRLSDLNGESTASSGTYNLASGIGFLDDAEVFFEEGDYRVKSRRLSKTSEVDYEFFDTRMTTCRCPEEDDCFPWQIRADKGKIEQEGYGQVWDATLEVEDFPIFYFPYLIFPAKTERQTGFLPFSFGGSNQGGFELRAPLFLVVDESTDFLVTPLIETQTRAGVMSEYRQVFSRNNRLRAGFTFLNESLRNGELQGTVVDGLDDPTIDENRFAAYAKQKYSAELGQLPLQFILDGRYISDDLLLREFEMQAIGDRQDRFITSEALVRTSFLDSFTVDLRAIYQQAVVSNDDLVFQRLPDLQLNGFHTFRPFGENPLGLKVVLSSEGTATNFVRQTGFDGWRAEIFETVKLPFFYKNYFDGSLEFDLRGTQYALDNTDDPNAAEPEEEEIEEEEVIEGDLSVIDLTSDESEDFSGLDKSSNRLVPGFRGRLSTVFQKVFQVPQDSWVKSITDVGRLGREQELVRLMHEIEPTLNYRYVPTVNQDNNPQFDANDRLARRNILTYSIEQTLFARFEPRDSYLYGVEEITPEAEDMGNLALDGPIDRDLSYGLTGMQRQDFRSRRGGRRRELATFELRQSIDFDEARESGGESGLSDLFALARFPVNEYFALALDSNFNVEDTSFSSYSIIAQVKDKRGDELRTALRSVEGALRQLESSLQLNVTEDFKVGYYSRWDDEDGQFIDNRLAFRLESQCDCWIVDLQIADQVNPDRTQFMFEITLVGLGEIGNSFFTLDDQNNNA